MTKWFVHRKRKITQKHVEHKTFYLITDGAITGWTSPTPEIASAASGHIEIATATVEGSVAVGDPIFTATATTDETDKTITYELVLSTDYVGVLGNGGAIDVATGKSLDYETHQQYIFEVR